MPPNAQVESTAAALIADHLPLGAPDSAAARLASFAEMAADWGTRMNLTSHDSALGICRALIGDAVAVVANVERVLGTEIRGRVIDLGSGAGFPGIPIALLRPEAQVDLVEIREKRHLFQRAVRRQLEISNLNPVRARIEDVAVEPCGLVIAQAVAPIAEIAVQMRPYLLPGARAVVPGGAELESPTNAADLEPIVIDYRSPFLDQPRRLWVGLRSE